MADNTARLFKAAMLLVVAAGAFWLLSRIGNLVKLVVIAALLAYMLDPIVGRLEANSISRTLSTSLVFVAIFGVITLFIFLLLPHITEEIRAIRAGITAGKAASMIHDFEALLVEKLGFLGVEDPDIVGKLQSYSRHAANEIYGFFINAAAVIGNLIIVPFIMFFFLKDGRGFIKGFSSLVPNRYFEMTLSLIHKTNKQLGGYIRGQFLDSAIIGGMAILVLWALDVKYFFLLGVVLGISNLVPFIGPIVGSIPAIAMALIETGSLTKALYVTLAMAIVQVIDNGMVKPVVVARMVSLHPVVVILAVIIGGKLFGVIGMILSVPVTGIVKLVAEEAASNIRKYRHTY